MDSYQPIFDAVRSRLSSCDVSSAVQNAVASAFDISHVLPLAQQAIGVIEYELCRPSVIYRPVLSKDGNMWIALYGENLQVGCVGCGETPEKAMEDFDKAWREQ